MPEDYNAGESSDVPEAHSFPLTDTPTEDEVEALKDELETIHDGDIKTASQALLEQKALSAIQGIAKLATNATHEQTRFAAQKYIVERVLGPLNKIEPEPDFNADPIVRLLKKAGIVAEDV